MRSRFLLVLVDVVEVSLLVAEVNDTKLEKLDDEVLEFEEPDTGTAFLPTAAPALATF